MTRINDVYSYLCELAPLEKQMSFDNAGFQLGRSGNEANPWMPSMKYHHTAVVSAIRMRLPELARQSMADHVDTSLSFTTLSGNGADPFSILRAKK